MTSSPLAPGQVQTHSWDAGGCSWGYPPADLTFERREMTVSVGVVEYETPNGTKEFDVSKAVDNGIDWLTTVAYGDTSWADEVDLSELDMQSPCDCVVGQLVGEVRTPEMGYGGFDAVVVVDDMTSDELTDHRLFMSMSEAIERGFHVPNDSYGYELWLALTEEWSDRIEKIKGERARVG